MVHTSHSISAKIFFIFLVWQNFEPIRVEGEMARKKTNKRWSLTFLQLVKYLPKVVNEGRFFHTKRITHNRWSWAIEKQHVLHEILFTNDQKLTIDDCGWLKNNSSCIKYFRTMVIKVCFFGKEKTIKQLMIAVDWKHVRLAWNILD